MNPRAKALCQQALAVLARMNQPSSWNAYAGLALALGVSESQWRALAVILAGICAIIATLKDDGTPAQPAQTPTAAAVPFANPQEKTS